MKRILLLVVLTFGCTENINILSSADGPTGTVPAAAVTSVEIQPSTFRVVNGEEFLATVVTRVGGLPRAAPFTSAIEGDQVVSIETATPSSVANQQVLLRATRPGACSLVVTAGTARGTASITVVAAN